MRKGFVFYTSFKKAIDKLTTAEEQLEAYRVITDYALTGEVGEISAGSVAAIFELVKPLMNADIVKYENGKKGGRSKSEKEVEETIPEPCTSHAQTKAEPNANQDETEIKPKPNQDETKAEPKRGNKKEKEIEKEKEMETEKEMRTCADFYTANIGIPSPVILSDVKNFIDGGISADCVKLALKKSVEAGAKNWSYAKKILQNWTETGITTAEKAKAAELDFQRRKTKGKAQEYPQHEYDTAEFEERQLKSLRAMEAFDG